MLIDVKVPVLAESIAEATLINWYKKAGEHVNRGDNLIDIETDKVTLEVAAPNDGTLIEILKPDGDSVSSDEVIARIDTDKTVTGETSSAGGAEQQSLLQEKQPDATLKLSPAVRNLLKEHRLDAGAIPASGKGGRLLKEDVINYIEKRGTENQQPAVTAMPPQPTPAAGPVMAPAVSGDRPEQRVPMTRLRQRTAERLLSAQHENAILTTFNEVNMQPVMDLRNRYKQEFEQSHGTKLGFMSFFTKAVVEALKKFPVINACINDGDIIYHGYFDIGIAVSTPKGLVVPILRDADLLSFAGVEAKIREYGEKAKDAKLTIEELTGGTFTITNGGIFGSLLSTPILNPPQSAILGMHTIQERPIAENGAVVIRPMMYLALSYDHRIIDGREAVQFLVLVKQQIEDPARLLLQI